MLTAQNLVDAAKKTIHEIDVDKAHDKLTQQTNIQIIDVREPDEYAQGHLNNAINIPRGLLEFKIDEIIDDKKTPVMVYCKTGGRAALSAQALALLGYAQVESLAGGFDAWTNQGLDIVK